MAPRVLRYAKDQPIGFINQIQRVAIVGVAGTMGKYITQELVKSGKFVVTAITRRDSNSKVPEEVIAARVDYQDENSIVAALQGQQCLIITLSVSAPKDIQVRLVRAAAKAGVPYVMPNSWGPDPKNESLMSDALLGQAFQDAVKEIEELGVSEWIIMSCGFWYEFSLGGSPDRYGFDMKNRSLIMFDDGDVKINTSTWAQCGRGIAAFLSLKLLPEDEKDNSPNIQKWANDVFYISSFLVSQRDMFESIKLVTETADEDWIVTHEKSYARWKAGVEALRSGDRNAYLRVMYTRIFFPTGEGNVQQSHGLANDALGLPKEDLDMASKEAVSLSLSGELENYS